MNDQYNITQDGMIQIAPGRYVNPKYASDTALATAKYNTTPGANTVSRNTLATDYGANISNSTPITASTLSTGTQSLQVTSPEPKISPAVGLSASVQADQDSLKAAQERVDKLNTGVDAIQKQRQDAIDVLSAGNEKAKAYQKEALDATTSQVDPAQAELNNIRTKEADTMVQYRAETDAIKTRGDISQAAQQGLQFNADDKYGRVLADLAIRKSAQVQNVADLRDAISKKLALQLAPIQTDQEFYTNFLKDNFSDLTQNEKDRVQQIISENDKATKLITDKENGIASILSTALENGVRIPDSVVSQVLSASSVLEATSILAANGISLQNPLDAAIKEANLANVYSQIAERNVASTAAGVQPGAKPTGKADPITAAYANRTVSADKIINELGPRFVSGSSVFGKYSPNVLKTDERQQYEQAQRNFVNAVLRKESGAAISPDEFTNAQEQYFPQPGDGEGVILQKAANRIDAMNGLIGAAGTAYNGTYLAYPAASADTTILIGPDGIEYSVPNNQVDAFLKAGGKQK